MSTIFGSPNDAYALGSQVRVDTEAHEDLQKAVQEAPKDEAGKTDPLRVLQLAAQGAMQAGHVQVADKFLKQSQTYQAQSTETQLNEFKLQHQKTDAAISQLQTAGTPEDARKLIMSGPAPENVKMQLVSELSKIGDNPEAYKTWRKQHEDALLTTKERTEAGIKLLELARKDKHDEDTRKHQLEMERIAARRGAGGDGNSKEETYQEHKYQDRAFKLDDEYSAEKSRIRKLDPKKYTEADKNKLLTDAQIDYEERKADLENSRPTKSKTAPTAQDAPPEAVSILQSNPSKKAKEDFDKVFGPGAADKALKAATISSTQKTHDGYPARANSDGSYSTEVSITVTNPRLNNGKPTNIPSLWKGKEVDEETAVKNAIASGKNYKAYSSIDAAVTAAKDRSKAGGAGAGPQYKNELSDEEQLQEDLSKATGVQERNAIRNDYNVRQERKAKAAKQQEASAKTSKKIADTITKAKGLGLVPAGMSGSELKFIDPKTGKVVLESEL